jgi:tRNA1Val (adenine37-N6)-methyltransferase
MIELYDGERIDYVNDALSLIQKPNGLTFGTDALLLAGYMRTRGADGLELGAGSGIISMLLLTRGKLDKATALEVQEEYAHLTERNAELNSLSDRLFAVHTDLREFRSDREYDTVYTNPPYMTVGSGRANEFSGKNLARHEVMGGISDFCICGARFLKYGGTFFAVYRPDRAIDILTAMRSAGLEPKRMTFVHSDTLSESSMMLIEAKKGGKSGLYLTPPLIIYSSAEHKEYSSDMEYIMENGSFPERFFKK